MTADAVARVAAQVPGEVVPRRVDRSDGHKLPCLLDRISEITVIRKNNSSVDLLSEDVNEKVRRHVDIGALLLAMRVRDHEHGVAHVLPRRCLNHHWPVGHSDDRLALWAARGKRRCLDSSYVVTEFDVVNGPCRLNSANVRVLVSSPILVGCAVDQRGAVRDPIDRGVTPVLSAPDEIVRQRTQVEPAPPGCSLVAQGTASEIDVEAVHVHPDSHR